MHPRTRSIGPSSPRHIHMLQTTEFKGRVTINTTVEKREMQSPQILGLTQL